MNQTLINYPDFAETQFRALCDLQNVTRNKAEQDRVGWDFLVEFERTKLDNVAHDKQVGAISARVQVKSARNGKQSSSLKLSNAMRFTKEPDICFVVLFSFIENSAVYKIFARHFDHTLMAATLKKAREADRDGKLDLHLSRVSVSFGDADDHTDDLINWMRSICDQGPEIYATDKKKMADSLGYETTAARIKISISPQQMQPFVDATVGLIDAVSIEHAIVQDVRFGIAARNPIVDSSNIIMQISINPIPACLKVEGANGASASLCGDFRVSFPGLPIEMSRAVFKGGGVNVVISGSNNHELNYEILADQRYTVSYLYEICEMQMAFRSDFTTTILINNAVPIKLFWDAHTFFNNSWFDKTDFVVRSLMKIQPHASTALISIKDIGQVYGALSIFAGLLSDADMTLVGTFTLTGEEIPAVTNYLGYSKVQIAGQTFWAIYRRPCLQQIAGGDKLTFIFGAAIVSDGAMDIGSNNINNNWLEKKTKSMQKRLGKGTIVLNNGDPSSKEDLTINIS
jgi:hypothetical protein